MHYFSQQHQQQQQQHSAGSMPDVKYDIPQGAIDNAHQQYRHVVSGRFTSPFELKVTA